MIEFNARSLWPRQAMALAAVMAGYAIASGCGQADGRAPALTPNIIPQAEEEVSEADTIRGLTIEDVRAIFGATPPVSGFGDRLPVLAVSPATVVVELGQSDRATRSISVSGEGPGEFEWDYTIAARPVWLTAVRPTRPEEGDIDSLLLKFNPSGLEPGRYTATAMIYGFPVARESPKEIPVVLVVR